MTVLSGVVRDERTVVVEDASYRFAYIFITYALLLDVMYRSLVRQEASLGTSGVCHCRRGDQYRVPVEAQDPHRLFSQGGCCHLRYLPGSSPHWSHSRGPLPEMKRENQSQDPVATAVR